MRRLIFGLGLILVLHSCASIPCGIIKPCPTPTPPPTCPEQCPPGTSCSVPEQGCVPIPPPEPQCVVGKEDCDCYVQPPGEDWQKLTCTPPRTCVNKVCTDPPPPSCPEACPPGQICTDPSVGCVPTPPTPPTTFPVRFPLKSAEIYMIAKRYGNGLDATVRVRGDRELCEALHHVSVPSGDCHFDSDVWSPGQRAQYEMAVYAGIRHLDADTGARLCPVWQFKSGAILGRCHDDRVSVPVSCDHFGDAVYRDDPNTPNVFEGRPEECGNQRDSFGPYAGFFAMPQCPGDGKECSVRSCTPLNEQNCSGWVNVDWK